MQCRQSWLRHGFTQIQTGEFNSLWRSLPSSLVVSLVCRSVVVESAEAWSSHGQCSGLTNCGWKYTGLLTFNVSPRTKVIALCRVEKPTAYSYTTVSLWIKASAKYHCRIVRTIRSNRAQVNTHSEFSFRRSPLWGWQPKPLTCAWSRCLPSRQDKKIVLENVLCNTHFITQVLAQFNEDCPF